MLGSILGAVAGPLIGGLLGGSSSKKGTTTTSENKLDPRMDRYVYGADGQSGLLGSAFNLAQEQMKNGGLNDLQRQGLDMQRQYLMSPQYQQGFSGMMGLGQQLMGGGVAGNPFNKSGGVAGNPFAGSPFAYSGEQNATLPSYTSQPSLTAPPAPAPTTGLLGGGGPREQGGGATGGGGGSSSGGQGISSAGISAALAAMAASENPAIRAISPTVAAILGIGGRLGADHQIGAISDSFGEMGAIDGMGLGGVGSIADADGNIRSVTTPGMVGAYDTATFGGGSGGGPNGPGGVNSDGNSYGGSWGASYGGAFNGGGGGRGGGSSGNGVNGGGRGGSSHGGTNGGSVGNGGSTGRDGSPGY